MARSQITALASASHLRARAAGAFRPSVEAILLAAVALGCAQTAWSVLAPAEAGARGVSADSQDLAPTTLDLAEVQSPFAPSAEVQGARHAIDALLATMQLAGVRMAEDDLASGAYLTMADGAQRAFLVGQAVADGVTLADVGADYILLAYDGGERRLAMSSGPSFSFARAMLGLEAAPGAPQMQVPHDSVAANEEGPTDGAEPSSVFASAEQSGSALGEGAWLAATLQQVQTLNGQPYGWRVAEPLPALAQSAGLRAGDVIVSVNGAGPAAAAQALTAAHAEQVELVVDRAGARLVLDLMSNG